MAGAIRYHLDEHVAAAVALGLRLRGIDVTTTAEEGLASATDEEQLMFAAGRGRVLVTHDADFLRLHAGGHPHAGIVYCHQRDANVGTLVRGLEVTASGSVRDPGYGSSMSGKPNIATSAGSWNATTREMPVAVGASTTMSVARNAPSGSRW
jgi:predicted nuclease of predicted toxin-antitoxin system